MLETQDPHLKILFRKYLAGQCSAEEMDALLEHFKLDRDARQLKGLIEQQFIKVMPQQVDTAQVDTLVSQLHGALMQEIRPKVRIRRWYYWPAAAAVLLMAVGLFFIVSRNENQASRQVAVEILPGGNRATLTLADGRILELSETQEGIIIGEDAIAYGDGTVVLESRSERQESRDKNQETSVRHTGNLGSQILSLASISTPKGGQYRITLPDGTRVWLNAASTLRYPTQFEGEERKVELTGEAYFEVSSRRSQPFVVYTSTQRLQVLGTVFNINAYADEPATTTTLVEGSVSLAPLDLLARATQLHPGEQSTLTATEVQVAKVDASEATSWKAGKFIFNETDIHAVMRQLARWYDAEVVYADELPHVAFSGSISRYEDIRDALRKITLMAETIELQISGRRIIVSRK